MCRKMETEEEKVLPFGVVPPTPRTEDEEEKTQDPKLNEIVSDYEVIFWIPNDIPTTISQKPRSKSKCAI